jgi:alkylhydroperoxidase/carboxymuconolactone decarboxylase family protein YurZ
VDYQEILRRLALGDTSFLPNAPSNWTSSAPAGGLDARSRAFARLGATVAVGANSAGYQDHVDAALAAGATPGDIVEVLIAVIPAIGLPKVVSAAPSLGLAVGYDVDGALEGLEGD